MVSFLSEQGVFEVHVLHVQNLELLPLARTMMQLSLVQIRKEPKHNGPPLGGIPGRISI